MKNIIRLLIDIAMTVGFLVLMDPVSVGGLAFHEWAGLAICLFFIVHKALKWQWIKGVTLALFGRITWKARLNYLIDVILLIGVTAIIWSGVEIAHTIDFSWLPDLGGRDVWRRLHASASMLSLAALGIHVGLHWDWIRARFSRRNGGPACA